MDFISKNCLALGSKEYDFLDVLSNIEGKVKKIYIASAYSDITAKS